MVNKNKITVKVNPNCKIRTGVQLWRKRVMRKRGMGRQCRQSLSEGGFWTFPFQVTTAIVTDDLFPCHGTLLLSLQVPDFPFQIF
ncbi:hypothetical protein NC652_039363 [Populus alba x Populus x berolinensis]|nr:hypothetical protein NC652_039363 [Populus alba x Populus x berolinensis]